ncbi:MAG: hypothetical protein Q8L14_30780 [Myxococcales bacterium]|nr:hypothetical protein [Myxococcales bacterium]
MPLLLLTLLSAQPLWLDVPARAHPGRVAEGPRGGHALLVPNGSAVLSMFEASGRLIGEPRLVLQSGLFAQFAYAREPEAWGVAGVREGQPRVVVFARVDVAPDGKRTKPNELVVPDSEGCAGDGVVRVAWSAAAREWLVVFGCLGSEMELRGARLSLSGEMTPVRFGASMRPSLPWWTSRGWVVGAQAATHYELYTLSGHEVSRRAVSSARVNESAITFEGEDCVVAVIEYLGDATQLRLIRVPPTGDVTSRVVATGGGLGPAIKGAPPILTQVWVEARPGKQRGFTVIVGEQTLPAEWPGVISGLRLGPDFRPTEPKRRLTTFGVTVGWVDVVAVGPELLIAAEDGELNLPHRRVLFTAPR